MVSFTNVVNPTLNEMQADIYRWASETFPNHTTESIIAHLNEEVLEAKAATIGLDGKRIDEELADCFILLVTLAGNVGVSLTEAVRDKHAVNVGRRWTMGPNGYNKHVEDDQQ